MRAMCQIIILVRFQFSPMLWVMLLFYTRLKKFPP